MIISKSMQKVIRVLLNRKEIKLRDLAREANVSVGITVKATDELEKTGYIYKKVNIRLKDEEGLLNAFAYTTSVNELETIEFTGSERPQYLAKKIMKLGEKNKLQFAFTLFSATEFVMPYVSPDKVHIYILKDDAKKWEKMLPKENIFPAEKGNVVCIPVCKEYLYNSTNNVVSLPQLYADLFSYRGRGRDAAEELLKVMNNV